VSPTLTLKVRNREQEHEALEKLQEAVADTLLELLADHLELTEHVQEWREQVEVGKALDRDRLTQAQEKQRAAMERRTTGPATAGRLAQVPT
jgi:TPP-dependent trihydroxycyclohexane-1,2-dione (THcHDO) dehydratase